jgi:hypothetical protein
MWMWSWIIPLGLQLGANTVIATLYKTTPGYTVGFRVADLFLFWTARPRLSWLVLCGLMRWGQSESKEKNGYYESAAKSSMIAEVILLCISSYYMGLTANFARMHGYYHVHSTASASAKLMYSGALIFLITAFSTLGYLLTLIFTKWELKTRIHLHIFISISTSTWLASWLFWVGYVLTAGEL